MTNTQKEMLEVYGKTNRSPSVSSFSSDFGISKDEARQIIDEWKRGRIETSSSNKPTENLTEVSIEYDNTGKTPPKHRRRQMTTPVVPSDKTTQHEQNGILELAHKAHTDSPWIRLAVKGMALAIGAASLVRGFIIIQEYNGNDWFSFLMPLIMQGVSLLFPVLGFMELEKVKLKKLTPMLGALFFFSFSAVSLYYEIQVSVQSFQQVSTYNLSMQIKQQDAANKGKSSNQIIDEKISNVRMMLSSDQELLKKRMNEFMRAKEGTKQYRDIQTRVNNIQSEMARYSEQIQKLLSRKQSDYVGAVIKYDNLLTIAPAIIIPIVVPIAFGIFLIF